MNGHAGLAWSKRIRIICKLIAARYGNPRHGNKPVPLDELIYIILSTRVRDKVYRALYRAMRTAYPSWDGILGSSTGRIARMLKPGGLSTVKARQIVAIVSRLRKEFGKATLTPLRKMKDSDIEEFLTRLPGVGQKVAKCVMMYSLSRHVLPVDVHVHRIAGRIGMRVKRRADTSQDLIEAAIPPNLRYGFHVNAIALGRELCTPRNPHCSECPIKMYCDFGRRRDRPRK